MRYYPAYLDLNRRNCLVVGGGEVAERKIGTLLACSAAVTVVSPRSGPRIELWGQNGELTLYRRRYRSSDLDNQFLVIGATDDASVNLRIGQDAEKRRILCNIVDRPQGCSFILPSIVQRGDLIIGISTSGSSPAMAKRIRQELDDRFGEEYGDLLKLMGALRRCLLQADHHPERHRQIFNRLIDADLLELIRNKRFADIDALLTKVAGEQFTYHYLMQNTE